MGPTGLDGVPMQVKKSESELKTDPAPKAEVQRPGEKGGAPGKRGYRNQKTLRAHLATLSEQELLRLSCASLKEFQSFEKKFYDERDPELPRKRKAADMLLPTQTAQVHSQLHQRIALGRAFQQWMETPEGQAAVSEKRQRRAFLVAGTERKERDVTKAETERLARAWQMVLMQDLKEGSLDEKKESKKFELAKKFEERAVKKRQARGEDTEKAAVPAEFPHGRGGERRGALPAGVGLAARHRKRLLRFQGRKRKCPALRERLYDWFVDMRSVFSKLSPGTVQRQALLLANKVWVEERQRGNWPDLPNITYAWVRGWRHEYRLSLRMPNRKFKLNKAQMQTRAKHVWRANLRVRWLAWFCLGRSLIIWGMDQKPIYMNEGGHKNQKTIQFVGAELAVAKDNIAQSRERVSAMTTATSDETDATASLPVGLCFKGKTNRVLKKLPKNFGKHVVFQFAPKGSYRVEQVVEFLNRALPVWTEERAAARDWRILYLDAYAAHFADAVVETAWRHGFVVLWHGAGLTGLMQVNDTHLHASVERIYLEMEGQSFAYQQYWDPSDISRHREDVAGDVFATWNALDHRAASKGHKSNGLNNALDGREDPLMSRDVLETWVDVGGHEMRASIKEEIREKVQSGEYRWCWETIQELVGRDAGERHLGAFAQEGRELEAAQQEGEGVYEDEPDHETEDEKEDLRQARAARKSDEACAATGVPPHNIGGVMVPALESDSEAAKRVAEAFAEKMGLLKELREKATDADMAPFRWILDRKIRFLTKSYSPAGCESRQEADLARRFLTADAAQEAEKRDKAREKARKRKQKLNKAKLEAQRLKNAAENMKLAKAEEKAVRLAAELKEAKEKALLEREITVAEMNPQGPKGKKAASRAARRDFLEQLRLIHGVSNEVQVYWEDFCTWYVDYCVDGKPGGASALRDKRTDFRHSADKAKAAGKHSTAFSRWVADQWKDHKKVK